MKPKKPLKKISRSPMRVLKRKAWDLQSKVIRQEEKECYTCGVKNDWKEDNLGHFIHKDCMDFVRENVHRQCVRCNKWLSGNPIPYAINLEKQYGCGIIQKLRKMADKIRIYKKAEILKIIEDYKSRIKEC